MRYLVGIGTYSAWDDSIGLRVAEAVSEAGLDVGFRAIELGGNLLDLLHYLDAETESVLIVDSAKMGERPGAFVFFTPDEVTTTKPLAGVSTHEGDLMKVLELASSMGLPLPPVTIMGIEPAEMREGIGLSAALGERLVDYVEAAVDFITGH